MDPAARLAHRTQLVNCHKLNILPREWIRMSRRTQLDKAFWSLVLGSLSLINGWSLAGGSRTQLVGPSPKGVDQNEQTCTVRQSFLVLACL